MLRYAIMFALLALLAGGFGFFALEGSLALIARIMLMLFLILFVVSLFGIGWREAGN